jgi:hypothetical protein
MAPDPEPLRDYAVSGSYASRHGNLRSFTKIVQAADGREAFRLVQSALRCDRRRSYAGKLNMRAVPLE